MNLRPVVAAAFAGAALTLAVPDAQATSFTYGFGCITGNVAGDCAIGEAQLFLTVFDEAEGAPAGQVGFRFDNTGPEDSSITAVYFDDDATLFSGIASISSGPGVSFSVGATPGNLPGGNPFGFSATPGLTADSDPPTQPNGVNPSEWLVLYLTLQAGMTYDDTIAALEAEALRVGIHVQGFETGGSESFINLPDGEPGFGNPIPEPGTLILLGAGLSGIAARRRLRRG